MHGVGIIGTGWGARVQVPAFRAAGLNIVALAGSQPAKTQHKADELGIAFATADWRAMLARDDVAVVSIVTPPSLHRDMAIAALEAGKHVLCEKPTALHADEARQMLAAAEQRPDQLALIDHELRFLPAFQAARRMIATGQIGQPRHIDWRFVNMSRSTRQRPWNWWSDAAQGGGVLGAISSHQIDMLRFLLADEAQAAQGILHTFVRERPDEAGVLHPVTADDFTSFHLHFGSGCIATVTASMVGRREEPHTITIYGDEGSMRMIQGRLWLAAPGEELQEATPPHTVDLPGGELGTYPEFFHGTMYLGHALRAALAGDQQAMQPAATFLDGWFIQQVLDTIRGGQ
jgi:predicted dehydrogenase